MVSVSALAARDSPPTGNLADGRVQPVGRIRLRWVNKVETYRRYEKSHFSGVGG